MFGQLLYTPAQDKYGTAQRALKIDRSQTYSNLNKSYSAYKSTEIGSQSPYRSTTVSRLEDAKRTIDSVIVDLNDKRDMNEEAIRQVRSVNSEMIDDFRRSKQFSVHEKENASTYVPDFRSQMGSASNYDLKVCAPQDDSLMLRERLNDEMKKNNELMLRMSRLEEENLGLKREYQMNYGQGGQARELQAENERLRRALAQASQLPHQIFEEIEGLKRENQGLRSDTVRLLKKMDHVI